MSEFPFFEDKLGRRLDWLQIPAREGRITGHCRTHAGEPMRPMQPGMPF
jgi:hypothetical protein